MKKCLAKLIASVVMSALIVMPVQAAPDTETIQTEIDSAQNEADSLQTQLRSVLNRIYTLESQMITTGEKIIQATADLESAEELEQQQYEDMKLRIKYIYEEGSNNTLEKLFTSGSFSELLNQAEYIQSMHSYDREMLNEYAATKDKVAELKSTLETEMAELETMQTDFSDQQASLNSTIASKQTEVSDLNDQLQTAVQATAEEMQVAENNEVQSQAADTEEQNQMDDNQVAAVDDITDTDINDSTDDTTDNTEDDTSNNVTDDQHQDPEPAATTEITTAADETETQIPVYDTEGDAAEDNTKNNNNSNNSTDNTANETSNTTNSDTDSNTNNASSANDTESNNTNTDDSASDTTSNTSSDTASSSNTTAAQKIVSAAYTQLGVNYVWGGTTPYVGLDCSGLTQYAHKQAGITIGRTSAVQGAGGKAVTTPQAGDLVCYAGHVGIYIGNGEMIHAPYTGTVVKVQSVYGSPWYRRYW
ncbi:MAG: NlpC/P60 family protein [Lachnospiraceae bacterium]